MAAGLAEPLVGARMASRWLAVTALSIAWRAADVAVLRCRRYVGSVRSPLRLCLTSISTAPLLSTEPRPVVACLGGVDQDRAHARRGHSARRRPRSRPGRVPRRLDRGAGRAPTNTTARSVNRSAYAKAYPRRSFSHASATSPNSPAKTTSSNAGSAPTTGWTTALTPASHGGDIPNHLLPETLHRVHEGAHHQPPLRGNQATSYA